jgi:hypothetical protein
VAGDDGQDAGPAGRGSVRGAGPDVQVETLRQRADAELARLYEWAAVCSAEDTLARAGLAHLAGQQVSAWRRMVLVVNWLVQAQHDGDPDEVASAWWWLGQCAAEVQAVNRGCLAGMRGIVEATGGRQDELGRRLGRAQGFLDEIIARDCGDGPAHPPGS